MNIEITNEMYAYFFHNVPGIGKIGINALLSEGRTAKEVYNYSMDQLTAILKSKGKAQELVEKRKEWDIYNEYEKLNRMGVKFLSKDNKEFPEKLKYIPNQPSGIFVKGNLPKDEIPTVAVVGARVCSDYGCYMARRFAGALAEEGIQVVSGLARGIDGIAQKEAIKKGGSTYAVLGCGVNVCYPNENFDLYCELQKDGGIISEYSMDTKPKPGFFPERNRIISGLADVILVIEAKEKSGTLITVDMALEQGKEVYVLPGRVTDVLSGGCNKLILQGAGMALNPEQIIEEVWEIWRKSGKYKGSDILKSKQIFDAIELEEDERLIRNTLSFEGKTIDDISKQVIINKTVPQILDILMRLMIKGVASNKGQMYFLVEN